jgi:hypothetical protein
MEPKTAPIKELEDVTSSKTLRRFQLHSMLEGKERATLVDSGAGTYGLISKHFVSKCGLLTTDLAMAIPVRTADDSPL